MQHPPKKPKNLYVPPFRFIYILNVYANKMLNTIYFAVVGLSHIQNASSTPFKIKKFLPHQLHTFFPLTRTPLPGKSNDLSYSFHLHLININAEKTKVHRMNLKTDSSTTEHNDLK